MCPITCTCQLYLFWRDSPSFWSKIESDFTLCPSFFKSLYVKNCRKIRNVPLFFIFSLICPSFWNLKVGQYAIIQHAKDQTAVVVRAHCLHCSCKSKTHLYLCIRCITLTLTCYNLLLHSWSCTVHMFMLCPLSAQNFSRIMGYSR